MMCLHLTPLPEDRPMKFTINKSVFLDVMSKVQGLTGRKSNLAITSNVLIRTDPDGINLSATDLQTGLEGHYPADIEREGTAALNAQKLFEIVRDFPTESIIVNEIENRWIEIGNDQVEYHIVGMTPRDFPDSPNIDEVSFFSIDSLEFKKMIEKTIGITPSPDDKRAHVNGLLLEKIQAENGSIFSAVSTDGKRLAKYEYPMDQEFELPPDMDVLIPKKGLSEVNKFLDVEGMVQVGFQKNHFIVKKAKETIIIRMLEGNFPDFSEIMQPREDHTIFFEKQMFLMMLKRMSILAVDQYVGVIFTFERDNLVIRASNPDIGESKEDLAIDFQGSTIEAAFNPRFFIDALNAIDSDKILLKIKDGGHPCIVKGENDNKFISVIMPMRI
jgi:DNA polymerase-3 subunit beta